MVVYADHEVLVSTAILGFDAFHGLGNGVNQLMPSSDRHPEEEEQEEEGFKLAPPRRVAKLQGLQPFHADLEPLWHESRIVHGVELKQSFYGDSP